jgi:hypothetical protein
MRSHRHGRAAAGIALILAGVAAALLARGAGEASRAFGAEQAHWQRPSVVAPSAPAGPLERAVAALLGTRARTEIMRAYSAYRRALADVVPGAVYPQTQARFDLIRVVTRLRPSLGARDGSRADVVLGSVYAASAAAAGPRRLGLLRDATAALRRAVLEDPANAEAKADLERLLTAAASRRAQRDRRSRSTSGGGRKDRRGRPGSPHAEQPGTGY